MRAEDVTGIANKVAKGGERTQELIHKAAKRSRLKARIVGGPPLFNTKPEQFGAMSVVRPVKPWDYTQQKRDFGQQELQKPQTALSRDAGLEQKSGTS
jgi:hypothetical protein